MRSNRVLVVIDRHEEIAYSNAAINAVNAARACYGFDCPRIVMLDPPVKLVSEYTSTGRAAGRVDNLSDFLDGIRPFLPEADAIAVSSVIAVPPEFHQDYFDSDGAMVNPWGGVEAIFTHSLSLLYGMPTAHSPMIESEEIESIDPGIVDPQDGGRSRLADVPPVDPERAPAQSSDRDRPGVDATPRVPDRARRLVLS